MLFVVQWFVSPTVLILVLGALCVLWLYSIDNSCVLCEKHVHFINAIGESEL